VCAVAPFARCRDCHGFGFHTTTDRKGRPKRGKTCRRCHGHGIRIRAGRHAYNLARGIHRDGTR
jgi:DnaJ-class molecular chaperone